MRATMSFAPPGGNGTITRTSLAGYVCDQAAPAAQSAQAKSVARSRAAFISFLPVVAGRSANTADYRRFFATAPWFSISVHDSMESKMRVLICGGGVIGA